MLLHVVDSPPVQASPTPKPSDERPQETNGARRTRRRRNTEPTSPSAEKHATATASPSPLEPPIRARSSRPNAAGTPSHSRKRKSRKSRHSPISPFHVRSPNTAESTIFRSACSTWEEMELHTKVVAALKDMGMAKPTQIQSQGIPVVLRGGDVMLKAETGSGKTLAYSVPIIHKLCSMKHKVTRVDGPYAIILAPTRELSQQIYTVMLGLVRRCPHIVPGIVTGGEKRKSEKARLRKGVNVLIATPGRLLDHLNSTAALQTSRLEFVVLDEADRLVDMGFERDITTILTLLDRRQRKEHRLGLVDDHSSTSSSSSSSSTSTSSSSSSTSSSSSSSRPLRQTIVTSATLQRGTERLAMLSMVDATFIEARGAFVEDNGDDDGGEASVRTATPAQLRQRWVMVPAKRRLVTLLGLLHAHATLLEGQKVIVFVSSIATVEFLSALLGNATLDLSVPEGRRGGVSDDQDGGGEPLLPCGLYKLHGNLPQADRTNVMKDFAKASKAILICTDVAARGLDLPHVSCIVQYDPPGEPQEYIHRVGRTARGGRGGQAVLFLLPSEVTYVELLEREYGVNLERVEYRSIVSVMEKALPPPQRGDAGPPGDALMVQRYFERLVASDELGKSYLRPLAVSAFQSYVRAYATHARSTKHIFHVKNLHLGHVATAFALKDAPSRLGGVGRPSTPSGPRTNEKRRRKRRKKDVYSRERPADEFASGF